MDKEVEITALCYTDISLHCKCIETKSSKKESQDHREIKFSNLGQSGPNALFIK